MDKYKNWFVIQTIGGKENNVRELIEHQKLKGIKTLLPKRKLLIRRKKECKWRLIPLFSGYLFIKGNITPEIYKRLVSLTGIVRIIRDNNKVPKEVPEKDMELIFNLMTDEKNEVIPQSQAILINDIVTIVGGPLKGMQGRIVKIDKRKRRAKVSLPFFNTYKTVTLAFELLDKEK